LIQTGLDEKLKVNPVGILKELEAPVIDIK
jgi:hypothetical protein